MWKNITLNWGLRDLVILSLFFFGCGEKENEDMIFLMVGGWWTQDTLSYHEQIGIDH